MEQKSSAHYQREYRKRLREQGLVKKEVWILQENAKQLSVVEKQLRKPGQSIEPGTTDAEQPTWTTTSLFKALSDTEPFANKLATAELIDGMEPALHIVMHEFGDLPIFVTVAGNQIVAEAVLWSADEVDDIAAFNEAVLRTHKYFPLSTISLDNAEDTSYYRMFGALSASSLLKNIVFELETLAVNVIQAIEAYEEFLKTPDEAQQA